jgi:hypothetical protein
MHEHVCFPLRIPFTLRCNRTCARFATRSLQSNATLTARLRTERLLEGAAEEAKSDMILGLMAQLLLLPRRC